MNHYIILRFGGRAVLLLSRNADAATLSRPSHGNWTTFNYSGCEFIGSLLVNESDPDPAPEEFIRDRDRFNTECAAKITAAFDNIPGLIKVTPYK